MIRLLAKAGGSLDALESDRYDAVTIWAVANEEDALTLLLDLGARPDQATSRYDGTALIVAAHKGHGGVVRRLIAAGAPIDHINNLHWTALIESIVLGNGGDRHVGLLLIATSISPHGDHLVQEGDTPVPVVDRGLAINGADDRLGANDCR